MITRRSLFGLALAPLVPPTPPKPWNGRIIKLDGLVPEGPGLEIIMAQQFPEEFKMWTDHRHSSGTGTEGS